MASRVGIIGGGPAGLACAYWLSAQDGIDVTLIDEGRHIVERRCPESKACNCPRQWPGVCDVLSGLGGAGGISDGKLIYSLRRGVQAEDTGLFTPEDDVWMQRVDALMTRQMHVSPTLEWQGGHMEVPDKDLVADVTRKSDMPLETYSLRHIGSDGIRIAISDLVSRLVTRGVNLRTHTRAVWIEPKDGCWRIHKDSGKPLDVDYLVMASGIAGEGWARDQLFGLGATVDIPGPAGIGVRLEAPWGILEPFFSAFYDWKVTLTSSSGIEVRSFCANREGWITNENHYRLGFRNVNGHSFVEPGRKSESSNVSLQCKIRNSVRLNPQRAVTDIGRKFMVTGMQSVRDFLGEEIDGAIVQAFPARTNLQAIPIEVASVFPEDIRGALREMVERLCRVSPEIRHKGIIYAPEVKYHQSKVGVTENFAARGVENLWVVGNATGYLDSYVTSAVSGLKAAAEIRKLATAKESESNA